MAHAKDYSGPALFSYGFRPFFLAATLFAVGVVPVWMLVWRGDLALSGPFAPVDWHAHEMVFGYAAAVIAGFLFTAVPNWTGRMPTRGWPLVLLLALWVLGRIAVAGGLPGGPRTAMAADCAFLLAIATMVAVEIVAGRNWRNLRVVVPTLLLFAANVLFHVEAMRGGADVGRRLGLAIVVFLVTLIGGRIIPSFTRNWLAQRRAARMPAPFGRFDGTCLSLGAIALLGWALWPGSMPVAALLLAAAGLHLARLVRWRGGATWPSPLLLMLHAAYLFVPLGLAATGLAATGVMEPAAGQHLLGIGAIGGMTLAVMVRATRGHTGRSLVAGGWLTGAFCLVVGAALVRALAHGIVLGPIDGIVLAATLWTLGFAILAVRLVPWLVLPSVARRRPTAHPTA